MKVFVTGASGWIASGIVPELIAAGHEVVGMARSDEAAARVTAMGAGVRRGELGDLDSLRAGAEDADAVIHLAFTHDFSDYQGAGRIERAAVDTFGDALAGTGKPFLFASGMVGMSPGRPSTEEDASTFSAPDSPRGGGEVLALGLADRGIRPLALRFAPTVHGAGDHGFTATLVAIAREKGVAGYVGDGANRWPAVHRLDAGHLAALALSHAGEVSIVHAVGEEGVATRDIAEAIGRQLGVPAISVAADDAIEHFGWIGRFFSMDIPASSAITRERLGWMPSHPTLLEDLESGAYTA